MLRYHFLRLQRISTSSSNRLLGVRASLVPPSLLAVVKIVSEKATADLAVAGKSGCHHTHLEPIELSAANAPNERSILTALRFCCEVMEA